ncbi:MAG: glutamate racemase [Spirochaetia bacterium]
MTIFPRGKTGEDLARNDRKKMMPGISSTTSSVNDERGIAFFDSGVGGLPYFETAARLLPSESFLYLCDRENFPYGGRPAEEICAFTEKAVHLLLEKKNPKIIVIACNTATVVALAHLRRTFSVPFVGVVPAVKPAALQSINKKIGILATARTVQDKYLQRLITDFAADCTTVLLPGNELVEYVEYCFFDDPSAETVNVLNSTASAFNQAGVDSVVLGCTHFIYIINELKKRLNPQIKIIDSREGVARQLVRVLGQDRSSGKMKQREMYHTGKEEDADGLTRFSDQFGLVFRGKI